MNEDDVQRIADYYRYFIKEPESEGSVTYAPYAPSVTSSKSHSKATGTAYQQTVIDYEPTKSHPVTIEQLQPLLDDMREKIVQQILDEISLLIDEAINP